MLICIKITIMIKINSVKRGRPKLAKSRKLVVIRIAVPGGKAWPARAECLQIQSKYRNPNKQP